MSENERGGEVIWELQTLVGAGNDRNPTKKLSNDGCEAVFVAVQKGLILPEAGLRPAQENSVSLAFLNFFKQERFSDATQFNPLQIRRFFASYLMYLLF